MPSGAANLVAFETALDQHEVHYMELKEAPLPSVRIGYSMENMRRLDVFFWFDEDGESVHFGSGVITHVPEDKRDKVLKAVNVANRNYRWISFFIDDDGDIIANGDQILTPDTVGDTCFELLGRTLDICDRASADFMMAIYKNHSCRPRT